MSVEHLVLCEGKLHLFRYPARDGKARIFGVLEPGVHTLRHDNLGTFGLGVEDGVNQSIQVIDASWPLHEMQDRPIVAGRFYPIMLKRPGEWVKISCTDHVRVKVRFG